jgi:hypothetical protein
MEHLVANCEPLKEQLALCGTVAFLHDVLTPGDKGRVGDDALEHLPLLFGKAVAMLQFADQEARQG